MEIKKLFHTLVYGDINMHTLAEFASELQKGKNYDHIKQIIKAYNDLPRFWRDTYKEKIEHISSASTPWMAPKSESVPISKPVFL